VRANILPSRIGDLNLIVGVTGGSGFVGGHLVEELSKKGYDVVVIDKEEPKEGFDGQFRKVDLLDKGSVIKSLEGLDYIFHLAAIADASQAYSDYGLTFDVNVIGTLNVLEGCRINKLKKIIYASTIWVYNASVIEEVNEDTLIGTDTKHVYTTTKLFGEFLCLDFFNMYGLPYTILRFGIPYGPGGRFNVIPIFVRKALNGEALTIRGSGEQKRQFVFVKDLAKGCTSSMKSIADNETINLVGKEMISVLQVAETVSEVVDNTKIEYLPDREGELGYRLVSGKKAEKLLGWKAETEFLSGVKETAVWYKENE
jgi:UDP-glucose 4-epimerase